MMTRQEMFTKAWNGLKAQNWQCAGAAKSDGLSFRCLYRDEQGRKCAMGHLLDDDYSPAMENLTAAQLVERFGLGSKFPIETDEDRNFLFDLQFAHDNAQSSQQDTAAVMIENLCIVAKKYNLHTPEPVDISEMIKSLPPNCS